ncbi:RNA ligase/cyclic nucleotide phosphodiesterase [Lipomyces arxii]|uniref:RNA ligase/cyclic nucleotide phosphodiesterase n=1 Tax=Lipomyces arxii TaxID=56418 RepID=UPI0034CDF923
MPSIVDPPLLNIYEEFILLHNTPAALSEAYEKHRRFRNSERKAYLQGTGKIVVDPILRGLVVDHQPRDFDPRNCITMWSRPTKQVIDVIQHVQEMLREVEPDLWLMPPQNLHLTALEILHSVPDTQLDFLQQTLQQLRPHLDSLLAPRPAPVLVKPILSYDQHALALSFLPEDQPIGDSGDWYSYHHYRSDIFKIVQQRAGVEVGSRYQVPSAHVTIARFIKPLEADMEDFIAKLEEASKWLETVGSKSVRWCVNDERGTELRYGKIWYGTGPCERIGLSMQQAAVANDFNLEWRERI